MNLLSHLYLSGNDTQLMIGNFIADHIKGNKITHFNPQIQNGILLHRQIDTYTDAHKIVRKSKRRLHERYRHYDGVIIDIFFDHFLAKNWAIYSEIPLDIYVNSVYQLLEENKQILPEKTQKLLPNMIQYNWLYNYQFTNGIQEVLNGINKRTQGKSQMNMASEDLENHYRLFEEDFTLFFEDLRSFCSVKITEIKEEEK
ncbi:ACP phosphodiesterase [Tenacibaculum finnmarkense]|uniref:acyl carrier protein phosphodiesterase n=1 Tax=Tenacibaculum finnmarkense TaxID=2781243 RepID=UPI001EFBBCF4|nr:acyl carrier protein phosphodiesterase [Tenacibaculum finnmarkense]